MSTETSTSDPRVLLQLGPIARLTLNRPAAANALDGQMAEEFESALAQITAHPEVRAVVVTGAGSHFCAGGDFAFIEENTRLSREVVEARMLRFYGAFLGLLNLPVPTCAAVSGSAIGAGLCLALACDLRIGARTARLGARFLHVGLHPGMGATLLVPHVAGAAAAAELLYGGAVLQAERAAALGLLNQVVPASDLESAVDRALSPILSAAPLALGQTVETLRAPLRERMPAVLSREAACQAIDFGTEDVRRAVAAFRSGGRPEFVGR